MNDLVDFGLSQELVKAGIVFNAGTVLRLPRAKAEWLEAQGAGQIKKSDVKPKITLADRPWKSK